MQVAVQVAEIVVPVVLFLLFVAVDHHLVRLSDGLEKIEKRLGDINSGLSRIDLNLIGLDK